MNAMPLRRTRPHRPRHQHQQITRCPFIRSHQLRPGDWVKLTGKPDGESLAGRVLCVVSLSCSITSRDQAAATWRVHFGDGRSVEVRRIERLATDAEIADAQRKRGQ